MRCLHTECYIEKPGLKQTCDKHYTVIAILSTIREVQYTPSLKFLDDCFQQQNKRT